MSKKSRGRPPSATAPAAAASPAGVDALFADALQALQRGQGLRCETLLQQVLRARPDHFDALHLLGLQHLKRKATRQGVELLERAAQLQPQAAAVHNNLGIGWRDLGDAQRALASYDRALELQPLYPDALNNRGNALRDLGRTQEALAAFHRALELKADSPQAWNNLGAAQRELGQAQAALQSFQQALAMRPEYAEAWFNRACTLEDLQQPELALQDYSRALQLRPDDVQALVNRGALLEDLQRPAQALADYDRAVMLQPHFADAWNNRGSALEALQRLEEALRSYRQALAVDSGRTAVLANCANLLARMGRPAEADAAFDTLVAQAPDHPYALGERLKFRLHQCDWREHEAQVRRVEEAVARGEPAALPFSFLSFSGDAALQKRCAEGFAASTQPRGPLVQAGLPAAPAAGRRIRVAYVSSDLHDHATAHLMAALFEQHDRTRFETWAVSLGPETRDPMRERLRKAFDRFVDASPLSDAAVVQGLRQAGIDIAVDLKGYTRDSRPGLFAMRLAPVQVAYLGYPGTTGIGAMDYLIADAVVVPPGAESSYSEKIVRLPGTYQVNDPQRVGAPVMPLSRAACGLPEAGFVFCCFNGAYKITPAVFDVWMRLLQAVPGSVLWLLEDSAAATAHLRSQAAARGVEPGRLVFAGRVPVAEHLARQGLADLFLDTLPVNAHTTASDALLAGLPVLTCAGEAFAGRVAASLLHAVGLPEMVAPDLATYEARALAFARTPPEARPRVDAGPLLDVDRFGRHLEAAYLSMWSRAEQGLPPAAFDVPVALM